MSRLVVAHYVQRYPVAQHEYIYDQIIRGDGRADVIVAGRLLDRSTPVPHAFPPWPGADLADRIRARTVWNLTARRISRAVADAALDAGASVVHAHFGMAGAELAHRSDLPPLITTFYGVDASACLRDPQWLDRYEPLFARGRYFIVLAEAVADRLVSRGVERDRVRVWNIGLDLHRYPQVPLRGRDGTLRILCAARFTEKKGHGILLSALRELRRSVDARVTLLGYGHRDVLARMVAEAGIGDHVTLEDTTGRDFHQLMSRAVRDHDVMALPSTVSRDGDDEAGPALTVVYAQASGLPVVVTPFVGSERSVVDGETGFLCKESPESLAERLAFVHEKPEIARRVGEAAAIAVREQFGLERQRQALDTLYRESLG